MRARAGRSPAPSSRRSPDRRGRRNASSSDASTGVSAVQRPSAIEDPGRQLGAEVAAGLGLDRDSARGRPARAGARRVAPRAPPRARPPGRRTVRPRRGRSGPRAAGAPRARRAIPRRGRGRGAGRSTRSQSVSTSASAWLDTKTACCSPRSRMSRRMSAPWVGSMPAVGSSSSRAGGSPTSATASPTRCRVPRDRVPMRRSASRSSPVRASAPATAARRASPPGTSRSAAT